MNSKLIFGLISFLVIILAGLVILNTMTQDNLTLIHVSDEELIAFKENCARYHDQADKGYEEFPALTKNDLTVDELRAIIRGGWDQPHLFQIFVNRC